MSQLDERLDPGPELSGEVVRALRAESAAAWPDRALWAAVAPRLEAVDAVLTPEVIAALRAEGPAAAIWPAVEARLRALSSELPAAVVAALRAESAAAGDARSLWPVVEPRLSALTSSSSLAPAIVAALVAESAAAADGRSLWAVLEPRLSALTSSLPPAIVAALVAESAAAGDARSLWPVLSPRLGAMSSAPTELDAGVRRALRAEQDAALARVDFAALRDAVLARVDAEVEADLAQPDVGASFVRAELASLEAPRVVPRAAPTLKAVPGLDLDEAAPTRAASPKLEPEEAAFRDVVVRELDQISPRIERSFGRELERKIAPIDAPRRPRATGSVRWLVPASRRAIVAAAMALAAAALLVLAPSLSGDDPDDGSGLEAMAEPSGEISVTRVAADRAVTILKPADGVVVLWLASADEPDDDEDETP